MGLGFRAQPFFVLLRFKGFRFSLVCFKGLWVYRASRVSYLSRVPYYGFFTYVLKKGRFFRAFGVCVVLVSGPQKFSVEGLGCIRVEVKGPVRVYGSGV